MLSEKSINYIFSVYSDDQDYLKWEVDEQQNVRIFLDISEIFTSAQWDADKKQIIDWDEFTDEDVESLEKAYSMLMRAGEKSSDKHFFVSVSLWLTTLYASIKHQKHTMREALNFLDKDINKNYLAPLFSEPWNATVETVHVDPLLAGVKKWLVAIGSMSNIGNDFTWRGFKGSESVTISANCSDLFDYASSDAEYLTEENKRFLKIARDELEALNSPDDPTDYVAVFYTALFATYSRHRPVISMFYSRKFPQHQKYRQLADMFTAAYESGM